MSLESSSRLVKDYLLKVLISEDESTRTWLAEQISISRPAIVRELKEERLDCKETFLAEARAKAAVDHPLIASVYEAASDDDGIFYAMELLPGCSLERYIVEGQTMAISQITSMLRRIAKSQMYLESLDQATLPISAADIFLDDMGVTRIANLAQPGPRKSEQSSADLNQLGFFLKYLPTPGQPGTTRLLTLLSWMRGEDPGLALTWQQVVDLCHQIDEQLLKQQSEPQTIPNDPSSKNLLRRPVILIASVIAVVAASVLALMMRPNAPKPNAASPLPEAVSIPTGTYKNHDGASTELPAFRISAHEVTIGQYASFLEMLSALDDDDSRKIFDHPDQPAEKTSHVPDDWQALHQAANSNGIWNHQKVALDSPVVGVDWWDAAAFATWKKGRLPTQDEWFAALTSASENPASIPSSSWQPVTSETQDHTPNGILGMAGNVCEWTRLPSMNPTNPAAPPQWVIVGGSYLKPEGNALHRAWQPDRSLRLPDLGFRLIFDVE